ncbi:MAG TPA: hypothetical protein VNB68_07000 [Nitrososphaeraceae archaeon]|jgi:hypothetical protein|nr:hypothetical protein [Nitrososphaeraceae archaeon]
MNKKDKVAVVTGSSRGIGFENLAYLSKERLPNICNNEESSEGKKH